jgi:hypothetical protein
MNTEFHLDNTKDMLLGGESNANPENIEEEEKLEVPRAQVSQAP